MAYTVKDIRARIMNEVETVGLIANEDAMKKVNSDKDLQKLADVTWEKFQAEFENDDTIVPEAIAGYAYSLVCVNWKGIPTLADRIVGAWYKDPEHPKKEAPQEPEPQPEPEEPKDEVPPTPKDTKLTEREQEIADWWDVGEAVLVYGPAGCGKTHDFISIAKKLDMRVFVLSVPLTKYDVMGFKDANGQPVDTAVVEAFMHKGKCLLLIDELDRIPEEVLIALNSALANGFMDTPRGLLTISDECKVGATANTNGDGADNNYGTASCLDMSTKDRFVMIKRGYDEDKELEMAQGDKYLVEFCHDFRQAVALSAVERQLFSYRSIKLFKIAVKHPRMGMMKAFDQTLIKGKSKDDCESILNKMDEILKHRKAPENKYHKGFREFVASLPSIKE